MSKKLVSFPFQITRQLQDITSKWYEELPLVAFCHDMTFPGARLTSLSDSRYLLEPFYTCGLPPNFTDYNGRVMPSGVYTSRILTSNYQSYTPTLHIVRELLGHTHGLHILEKKNGRDDLYTFFFNCSDSAFDQLLLQGTPHLQNRIASYRKQAETLIQSGLQTDNQVVFTPSIIQTSDTSLHPHYFNHKSKRLLQVTPQQRLCLQLLLQGLSAKEVAKEMALSYRTVEHYIAHIRQNNDLATLKELLVYVKEIK